MCFPLHPQCYSRPDASPRVSRHHVQLFTSLLFAHQVVACRSREYDCSNGYNNQNSHLHFGGVPNIRALFNMYICRAPPLPIRRCYAFTRAEHLNAASGRIVHSVTTAHSTLNGPHAQSQSRDKVPYRAAHTGASHNVVHGIISACNLMMCAYPQ